MEVTPSGAAVAGEEVMLPKEPVIPFAVCTAGARAHTCASPASRCPSCRLHRAGSRACAGIGTPELLEPGLFVRRLRGRFPN